MTFSRVVIFEFSDLELSFEAYCQALNESSPWLLGGLPGRTAGPRYAPRPLSPPQILSSRFWKIPRVLPLPTRDRPYCYFQLPQPVVPYMAYLQCVSLWPRCMWPRVPMGPVGRPKRLRMEGEIGLAASDAPRTALVYAARYTGAIVCRTGGSLCMGQKVGAVGSSSRVDPWWVWCQQYRPLMIR